MPKCFAVCHMMKLGDEGRFHTKDCVGGQILIAVYKSMCRQSVKPVGRDKVMHMSGPEWMPPEQPKQLTDRTIIGDGIGHRLTAKQKSSPNKGSIRG